MANKIKLQPIKDNFQDRLALYQEIYDFLEPLSSQNQGNSRRVMKCQEIAFLGVLSAWENFLEATFLRYMTGAVCDVVDLPTLRFGPVPTLIKAGQLLRQNASEGKEAYLTFSVEKLKTRVKLYFEGGIYINFIQKTNYLSILGDAEILRNHTAHESKSAKEKMKRLRRKLIPSPAQGASTGVILQMASNIHPDLRDLLQSSLNLNPANIEIFKGFIEAYKFFSEIIVPSPS